MLHYSQKDFDANPIKYRLFKTAVLAVNIPGTELTKGQHVGIRYLDARINRAQAGDPIMPIYEVQGVTHYLYAMALADFCL
jgi:hypothetical protein